MEKSKRNHQEISHDNPDKKELSITYANLVEEVCQAVHNKTKHPVPPPFINSHSNPLKNPEEDKLRLILKSAKRRVGLKPMLPEHLLVKPILDDINDPKYSDTRKEAAKELLDKELKINTDLKIISTKMSQSSPILWIELEDHNTADMIIKQSAKVRNPDSRAILYPPMNFYHLSNK